MTTETQCPKCGHPYGKRRRCYLCQPGNKKSGETLQCLTCGATFYRQLNQLASGEGKFCSYECKYAAQRHVERVTGTRYVRSDGYVAVKVGIRHYELEHRLVAERMLGRKLTAGEQVHHINGQKADNRPENLQVLTNAEHQRLHDHLDVIHTPRRVRLTCEVCGIDYETRPSRAATSTCCSAACRMVKARAARKK